MLIFSSLKNKLNFRYHCHYFSDLRPNSWERLSLEEPLKAPVIAVEQTLTYFGKIR